MRPDLFHSNVWSQQSMKKMSLKVDELKDAIELKAQKSPKPQFYI